VADEKRLEHSATVLHLSLRDIWGDQVDPMLA
jgi:hypothetical protein